jgi:hypothetical protein
MSIIDQIAQNVVIECDRVDGGLLWRCSTKSELHSLFAKVGDVVMNELQMRTVRYGSFNSTVYYNAEKTSKVTVTPNSESLTLRVQAS